MSTLQSLSPSPLPIAYDVLKQDQQQQQRYHFLIQVSSTPQEAKEGIQQKASSFSLLAERRLIIGVRPEKKRENTWALQIDPEELAEYAAAARTIARCHDIFCDVGRLLNFMFFLQQEELAANGELSEDEDSAAAWERVLSKVLPKSCKQCKCTYDALLQYAPGLKQLLDNCKKRGVLHKVITEMNKVIQGVHLDDATCLKAHIGTYAVPHPLKYSGSKKCPNVGSFWKDLVFIWHMILYMVGTSQEVILLAQ
ncbi:hypothetical protein EDC04DRAFT_2610700 [Pisolithus marmoratus]|nr:hypothetical protein EDC04DRAFT_2610700 [Pisolithus marmoratus]